MTAPERHDHRHLTPEARAAVEASIARLEGTAVELAAIGGGQSARAALIDARIAVERRRLAAATAYDQEHAA